MPKQVIFKREDILPEVLYVHNAFASAWKQMENFYKNEINSSYCHTDSGAFIAELDSKSNVVILNFVIEGNVLRHSAIKVDSAFFFSITNQNTREIISDGIKIKELLNMNWGNVIFFLELLKWRRFFPFIK